jgi:addiction module RelE/StbE family toxin
MYRKERSAMGRAVVYVSNNAQKKFEKLPPYIQVAFYGWVKIIEEHGLNEMQKTIGFRDHALIGKLSGLRASSLNRSYRVIYKIDSDDLIIIYVLEVNKHDYKI